MKACATGIRAPRSPAGPGDELRKHIPDELRAIQSACPSAEVQSLVSTPAVSIIIPLFNKRKTIARTLRSVLAQTTGDFELIMIDDGSTDDGAAYVEAEFRDRRLQLHRQENAGPGAARNKGLALSRGEFVTFLDADDTWSPRLLERAIEALRKHPDCGAFTCSYYLEPSGHDRWQDLQAFGFREGIWRFTAGLPRHELRHCLNAFNNTNATYRRSAALAAGGFYTKDRCTLGEDAYFWIQVLLHNPIYRCMEPLAHYHTEDSELGVGARAGELPLEPILTDPGPIRAACPSHLLQTFELWLAHEAARSAFMQLERGGTENARWLLRQYPRIRDWPAEHVKLRARLAAPNAWGLAQRIKLLLTSTR